jgi:general secretion pathway protein G
MKVRIKEMISMRNRIRRSQCRSVARQKGWLDLLRAWHRRRHRWCRHDAGYSLLEVLVVLSIIALIAAVVGPRLVGYLGKAKADTARIQMREIASALELYYLDNGSYPTEQSGLGALMAKPAEAKRWNGPYLKKAEGLVDPWGQPYGYKLPAGAKAFVIVTLGADGAVGGEGDNADILAQ